MSSARTIIKPVTPNSAFTIGKVANSNCGELTKADGNTDTGTASLLSITNLVSNKRKCAAEQPTSMTRLAINATFEETFKRAETVIAPLNTQGGKTPIYWIHSIVGCGTDPIRLSKLLGATQPFYSIRVPSRLRNGAFSMSVDEMADRYIAELIKFQPTGPIILGGWSAGVVVALDMARKLRAAGREVAQLVAIDFAPFNTGIRQYHFQIQLEIFVSLFRKIVRNSVNMELLLNRLVCKIRKVMEPPAREHPADKFVRHLSLNDPETGFVRSFHDAVEAYIPARYDGRVLLYSAVQPEKLRSGYRDAKRRNLIARWRSVAPKSLQIELPGDHESIIIGSDVHALAADISVRLGI